jgi:hypothetical protein
MSEQVQSNGENTQSPDAISEENIILNVKIFDILNIVFLVLLVGVVGFVGYLLVRDMRKGSLVRRSF